jgi:hypothetical protein
MRPVDEPRRLQRFRTTLAFDVEIDADVTEPTRPIIESVRIGRGEGLSEIAWALHPRQRAAVARQIRAVLEEPLDVGAAVSPMQEQPGTKGEFTRCERLPVDDLLERATEDAVEPDRGDD